ncbi:MCE family protein [Mycobacterium sp.]|uniref:MCE family protein n=1 Tax=Mycobacterium sp. TaxID=1785 RepID=UPI0031D0553A
MLTRGVRRQLVAFGVVTVVALLVLGWYYLRIPTLLGIGQYTLNADLPASGGLYVTSNVTYRGITIGKVTAVEPTEHGARATMSIASHYKIPVDASANVHSVSAVGEQYLDLVSVGNPGKVFSPGQTITNGTVPAPIGPALDATNRALSVLPTGKLAALLNETSEAVGGLGPALQRLVDSTQAIVGGFKTNIADVNSLIQNSEPILDSQVVSGKSIEQWARNLNVLAAQTAAQDQNVKNILSKAPPTADQITAVFGDIRETLPQTLANTEIVLDMLKRYNKNIEQVLVFIPEGAAFAQTLLTPYPGKAALDLGLAVNYPPPCLTGFIPASEWRSPADTSLPPLPVGNYCKIPQDTPANSVRGVRNSPCVDVPGKRAATPRECRDPKPYVPAGTNPWYGDPNQIRNCPAPGARCDQPVDPGHVIQAPSINNGINPAPANRVAGTPPPVSDPLQRPGSGSVQCNGQQPNPCVYTPSGPPAATYSPQSGEVSGPDGVKYSVENSNKTGDDGWKEMLAPAS